MNRNSHQSTLLAGIIASWTIYVVAVGGDVLYANRFFIPIIPLIAILVWRGTPQNWQNPVIIVASGLILYLNNDDLRHKRDLEVGLVNKMRAYGEKLNQISQVKSVAATTIGALGYYSSRLTVIDMLGLTDSTVARHPRPVAGVESNWRERKYNSVYVLNRAPEAIVFSTGPKPSAPAERALLCYPGFRLGYDYAEIGNTGLGLYVRVANYPAGEPTRGEWVNAFVAGMNHMGKNQDSSRAYFRRAVELGMPGDYRLGNLIAKEVLK